MEVSQQIEMHKNAQKAAEQKLNNLPVDKMGGPKNPTKADELARTAAYHEREWRKLTK